MDFHKIKIDIYRVFLYVLTIILNNLFDKILLFEILDCDWKIVITVKMRSSG